MSDAKETPDAKSDAASPKPPKTSFIPYDSSPAPGTPEGVAIERARGLFALGDYADVRAIVEPLRASKDPDVARAANELVRQMAVDPVQIGFLVGCLLAIATIAVHYLGH